ncbi:MAG: putative 60 kDa chaperonin [Prokaryotic dsDNA virus sp.]|nr:MAG: putative 60 kDa chaperonin [Prokaryotic dsDNA virus sp.]|tara:strand:+ start:772 stop:2343 length:1572 start_codon:yes stop_codon:yes gene_type:complete
MNKTYSNGSALSEALLRGIDTLADNVASTLGPKGRNVILYHKEQNTPVVTKDGVTIAKFVELDDPVEHVGAQIVKQAAEQSANTAGDGTTTTTVLARAMIKEAQKYIVSGVSPIEIKRGMDQACEQIVETLKESARQIRSEEDIRDIATISANNDKSIGTLVSTAVDKAGKDGSVLIEEARSMRTTLELIEGFRMDTGYLASSFITNERTGTVEYDNPLILVTDDKVEHVEQIYPTLELAARESRPLVLVASEVEGQALAALIMNSVRGTMKVCAVKAPRYGEERRKILRDLCLSVGATFITREDGLQLKDIQLGHFGQSKSISVGKLWTTIVGGKGDYDGIDKQIGALKVEISQTDNIKECERIQERITRLASGVAVIRVGAPTEVEMIEKKHRIEDALEAVRSAQEMGVIAGGGSSLVRMSEAVTVVSKEKGAMLGFQIVLDACEAPLRQMCLNAGESPDIIVNKVKSSSRNNGYNFMTGEIEDFFETGVIDPVKVTISALENATSVASTLITTNHAIVKT